MRTIFLLALIAVSCCSLTAVAQMFPRHANGASPPKALLVEILTRKTQRDYLREHRPDLLREFNRDVSAVAKRTVMDFSRYFHYCPVYFFIDSLADRIASGGFEGVLLDSTLNPAGSSVLTPGDKNFFIAHYGSPIPQPDSVRPASPGDLGGSTEAYGDDPTALFREKLLVTDADFKLLWLKGPRTNYVRALHPSGMSSREYRAYRRAITYNATRWYIDYLPCAYSYEATLKSFFR